MWLLTDRRQRKKAISVGRIVHVYSLRTHNNSLVHDLNLPHIFGRRVWQLLKGFLVLAVMQYPTFLELLYRQQQGMTLSKSTFPRKHTDHFFWLTRWTAVPGRLYDDIAMSLFSSAIALFKCLEHQTKNNIASCTQS